MFELHQLILFFEGKEAQYPCQHPVEILICLKSFPHSILLFVPARHRDILVKVKNAHLSNHVWGFQEEH